MCISNSIGVPWHMIGQNNNLAHPLTRIAGDFVYFLFLALVVTEMEPLRWLRQHSTTGCFLQ